MPACAGAVLGQALGICAGEPGHAGETAWVCDCGCWCIRGSLLHCWPFGVAAMKWLWLSQDSAVLPVPALIQVVRSHRLLTRRSALFTEGWKCGFQLLNGLMFSLFAVFHFLKLWLCLHCTPVGSTKPLKSKQLARHLRFSVTSSPCFSSYIFSYIPAGDAHHTHIASVFSHPFPWKKPVGPPGTTWMARRYSLPVLLRDELLLHVCSSSRSP